MTNMQSNTAGLSLGISMLRFRMRQIEKVAAKLDKFIVLTKSDKKDWEPFGAECDQYL